MSGVNIIAGSLTTTSALNITGNMGIGGNATIGGTTTIAGNLNAANIQFVGGGGGTAGVTSITAGGVANLSGVVQFVAGTNLSIGGSLPGTVTVDLSGIGNPMPTDLDMSGWSLYSSTTSNVTVSGTLVTSSISASTPNLNISATNLNLYTNLYQPSPTLANTQVRLLTGDRLSFINPSCAIGAGILLTSSGQLNIFQTGTSGSAGQITFTNGNGGTPITINADTSVDMPGPLRVAGQPVVTGNVVTSISAGGVTNLSGVVQFLSLTNTVTISAGTGNQLYFDVSTSNVLSDWARVPASSNVDMNGKSLYTNTGNVTVSGNTNIYPNVNTSVIGPTTIYPSFGSYSISVTAQRTAGYDRALVQMWGGAGGPAQFIQNSNNNYNQGWGGAGGYLEFTLSTAGVTNFNASVGGAGRSGFSTSAGSNTSGGYNYGGMGGSTGFSFGAFGWAGGGGGGATTFLIDNSLVAIAGGGGGAGPQTANWITFTNGGGGGSSSAQNGATAFSTGGVGGSVGSNGGAGGTGYVGGSNGNSGGNGAPNPTGVSFGGSGGNGTASFLGGGGGGAGWGGGGGGGTFYNAPTFGGGAAGGGTSYLNNTSYGVVLACNVLAYYYNPAASDSDAPNAGSGVATNAATAYDGAVIVTFYSSTAGTIKTTALTISGTVQAEEYVTSTQLTPVLNSNTFSPAIFTASSGGVSVGYYVATSYSLAPGNQLVVAPFAVTYDGTMVPSTGNITSTATTNVLFVYTVSGNTLVLANNTATNFSNVYTRITKLG